MLNEYNRMTLCHFSNIQFESYRLATSEKISDNESRKAKMNIKIFSIYSSVSFVDYASMINKSFHCPLKRNI
nr:MAG TPA: hypothetical protein [Caudoviricetes sp.]